MQLTGIRREFATARWELDVVICVAAALSLPFLMRILAFPLKAAPITITQLIAGATAITLAYLLSALLAKWLIRIRSWSFVWVALVGSMLYAIVRVMAGLPAENEYHSRFLTDISLTAYLYNYSVGTFIFVAFFFGGFSLIVSSFARILCAGLQSHKLLSI